MLVGAVGIELLVAVKTQKLLILHKGEMAKNTKYAEPRYTWGTRESERFRLRNHTRRSTWAYSFLDENLSVSPRSLLLRL